MVKLNKTQLSLIEAALVARKTGRMATEAAIRMKLLSSIKHYPDSKEFVAERDEIITQLKLES